MEQGCNIQKSGVIWYKCKVPNELLEGKVCRLIVDTMTFIVRWHVPREMRSPKSVRMKQ